jgi:hypothetical protein
MNKVTLENTVQDVGIQPVVALRMQSLKSVRDEAAKNSSRRLFLLVAMGGLEPPIPRL